MIYDSIIVGAGPAGLTAAIYATRSKMNCLVLEAKINVGGQIATTHKIDNWPGKMTTGPELMKDFEEHCRELNISIVHDKVINIEHTIPIHKVFTASGKIYEAKTIILATGAEPRILGLPGEKELRGRGVAYCAACDGEFFEDLEIVAVGSGNTSLEESVFLTRFAKKVTIIVLHPEGVVDGDKIAYEHAKNNDKIHFVWDSTISEIYGEQMVQGIKIKNIQTNEITDYPCDGVFMFVGIIPNNHLVKDHVKTDNYGYVTTEETKTAIPGIFAAGDLIEKNLRQVVTATSDGAIAAIQASKYIEQEFNN